MKFCIKDSVLVVLVNKIRGGVSYQRENESIELDEDAEKSTWQSRKVIYNVKERSSGNLVKLYAESKYSLS